MDEFSLQFREFTKTSELMHFFISKKTGQVNLVTLFASLLRGEIWPFRNTPYIKHGISPHCTTLNQSFKKCSFTLTVASFNYRLTHSTSELLGFTCTSSLFYITVNEKFQYRTRPPSAVLKISSSLLVNVWRKIPIIHEQWIHCKQKSYNHGVMTVVYWIYTTAITPR